MENAQTTLANNRPFSIFSLSFSLALWLLPQLLILFLTLHHVPLWLKTPIRMDDLALPALLCVQTMVAAMFFPILLRNWESALAVIAVTWPMIQFAAFISAVPTAQWASAGAFVSLLLAAGMIWNRALPTPRARQAGVMAAVAWTMGGVLLAYLHAEFSAMAAPALEMSHAGAWSPLLGALEQLQPAAGWGAWWPLIAASISGCAAIFIIRGRNSRNHLSAR